MTRFLFYITLTFCVLTSTALAAQELAYETPKGWVKASPTKSSVARLQSSKDKLANIEVRTASIDASKSEQFFSSFRATLLNAGMKKISDPTPTEYAGKGTQTEYESKKGDVVIRIVIWQTAQKGKAWTVVGVFPKSDRSAHLESYSVFSKSLKF